MTSPNNSFILFKNIYNWEEKKNIKNRSSSYKAMRVSHVNQGNARQRVRQWLPPSPKYHVPVFVACNLRFSFSSPSPPSLPPAAAVNITFVRAPFSFLSRDLSSHLISCYQITENNNIYSLLLYYYLFCPLSLLLFWTVVNPSFCRDQKQLKELQVNFLGVNQVWNYR